ncbi:MAG: UDP-N-acetylmuramate dehydrogenase [Moraxellaceae bacterium]|nr:UDP-N-acetylmuramate dehydrogenase [Moraxellaceae bacterium]MDZ4386025.1 UDP-N-acetylmuramate dehydrogenase [Moraxellaceae bacterium]
MFKEYNPITFALIDDLRKICPEGVVENVSLKSISSWKTGGNAVVVIQPSTIDQICSLRKYFFEKEISPIIIGMTTNLLFSDAGLLIPCIQLGKKLSAVEWYGDKMKVQAGCWVPALSRQIQRAGFTGAEHIAGIPGTIGGLVYMNGGSQRKGIGESVIEVESISSQGEYIVRTQAECSFAYRESIYQSKDEVITNITLKFLKADNPQEVHRKILSILSDRRKKFPRKTPNCGSVFKSDPSMYDLYGPPGKVIEEIGLKGFQSGGAEISSHHANFITNFGSAKSEDILKLIKLIKNKAYKDLKCELKAEVRYVDPFGKIFPADQVLISEDEF